jgi:hypothetical protein
VRVWIAEGMLRGPQLQTTGLGLTARESRQASTIFKGNPWFRAPANSEVDSPQMMRDTVHHRTTFS